MRKLVVLMVALCMVVSVVAIFASPADDIAIAGVVLQLDNQKAIVEGKTETLDVPPMVVEGRTLLPLRFVAEKAAGAAVAWDDATKTATITAGDKIITVTLGEKKLVVNGSDLALDVAATVVGGRTLVPLRAIVDAIGKKVFWDPTNKLIVISKEEITADEVTLAGLVDRLEGAVAIVKATPTPTPTPAPTEKPKPSGIPKIVGKGTSLYKDTFDKTPSAKAFLQKDEIISVVNGKLQINEVGGDGWACYGPSEVFELGKYSQIEYSFDISSIGMDAPVWLSAMIGVRIGGQEIIANDANGFYVAVKDNTTSAIYAADAKAWPTSTVTVDQGFDFSTSRKVTVVDRGDQIVYYAKDDAKKDYIIARVEFVAGGTLKVYDNAGKVIYTGAHTLNDSGYFKIFAHSSAVVLDNFEVIGVE